MPALRESVDAKRAVSGPVASETVWQEPLVGSVAADCFGIISDQNDNGSACVRARGHVRVRARACVRVRVRTCACVCACARARAFVAISIGVNLEPD